MNKRIDKICIRLSSKEKELLELQTKKANMNLSQYLRSLGLNYPIESKTDYMAIEKLNNAAGDLGRLGGLFKMWLSNNKHDQRAMLGEYNYNEVGQLVDDILEQKAELMKIAKSLFKK